MCWSNSILCILLHSNTALSCKYYLQILLARSAMCLRLLANIQFRYIILNVHCYPCFCFIFARQNYCHQKCRANMSGICQGCIFSLIEASWWCSVQHLFLCVKITAIMLTNNLETSGAPSWWYWKETLLWVSSEQMNHVTYASICSYISIQYYYSAPGSALCWVWNDKLELCLSCMTHRVHSIRFELNQQA